MLPQIAMIERLRQVCQQDERLTAAALYGSFALREADRFSDIDVGLFFADESLAEIDQRAWVSQIAPVELYYLNEFGNGATIFSNLVRAEFHFECVSDMRKLERWQGKVCFPSLADALLVDKTGELAKHLQILIGPPPSHNTSQDVLFVCHSFLNWFLMGTNVLTRGELARALEVLLLVQDHLLRMARIVEGKAERWITPTKALEQDISAAAYSRYQACTAGLERDALESAYVSAWRWGNELMAVLAQRYGVALPTSLIGKLNHHVQQWVAT